MDNYSATVVRISNLRPHTNADRLICTSIFGNNVIVGKETKIGDLGLYFPLESQLGLEFAQANDLIRRGGGQGGMFDDNRRVRAQKFRGERSMGFWIPIDSLQKLHPYIYDGVQEGDELTTFGLPDGTCYQISAKYIPRTSQTPGSGKKKEGRKPRESRIIPDQFRFHFDTAQLGKNMHKIDPKDLIVVTWKLHGTSAIVSNCLVKKKLGIVLNILNKIGVPVKDSYHDYIYASRRVVKNEFEEAKQHFYKEDLWSRVGKELFEGNLHTGETIYYEIVGYTQEGGMIQKDFDYHCEPGTYKVYVYRITQTAADGTVFELQWQQVKQRCAELNVPHVPEIFHGYASDLHPHEEDQNWHENFLQTLKSLYVYDQDSQFCRNRVPEEGICLRKEGLIIDTFKLKSFRFLEYETKQLDAGTVDLETNESL